MGEIGDVWNVVKDTVTLFGSGQSQTMPNRACAVPHGKQPNQLDWANAQEKHVQVTLTWTNRAKEWWGLSTGTQLRLGATWMAPGTDSEFPDGQYLHDARLWANLDHSTAGTNYTVTANFGDAVMAGNVAQVTGTINWSYTQFGFHMEQGSYVVILKGDGSGTMTRV